MQELAERPLRWLHISDIHLKKDPLPESGFILGSLLTFLENDRSARPLDFILLTGDLAFSGGAEEYELVGSFLRDVAEKTGVPASETFVVPGNHDVDRSKVRWLCRTLSDQQQIDGYFQPRVGLPHILNGQSAFLEWHDRFFSTRESFAADTTCQSISSLSVRGQNVDLLVINTAAFARDDDDHGKLVVGRSCLEEAVKGFRPDALRIGIGHHPIDWLHEVDRPFVRSKLRSSIDLYLHGHTHDPDAIATFSTDGNLAVIGAGATYQTEKYLNSFWIGEWNGEEVRLLPFRYSAHPRPIWSLDTSIAPSSIDYSVKLQMERLARMDSSNAGTQAPTSVASNNNTFAPDTLLVSPRGEPLYVEPRLGSVPLNDPTVSNLEERTVELTEVVDGPESYIIESKSEYGATTLGLRLEQDIRQAGKPVKFLNAHDVPAYGEKLQQAVQVTGSGATLILDDFDISDHRRLIKYIKDLKFYDRYILITRPTNTFKRSSELQIAEIDDLKTVFHWPLSRPDLRKVARQVFGEVSEELENAIVEKVYNDLLSLKIPLSPGNVIMYLRVLLREEHFAPANRVDIIFRYVAELLRRSSDIYQDSFGYKSKIDILSAFSYSLYVDGKSDFAQEDWNKFCRVYSDDTLLDFDANDLLIECVRVKIFAKYGNRYFYRYGSYFPLFVGKHISAKPSRVLDFVQSDGTSRLGGLVEVVSALSADNTELVESLTAKLAEHLGQFRDEFIKREFEPYRELPWGKEDANDDRFWESVDQSLLEGPQSAAEIDRAKTSLISEIRTDDQSVEYNEMVDLESALFRVNSNLSVALRNSESISGPLKIEATKLVHEVELVALQVGFLLAPRIAESYYLQWGGIGFVNPKAVSEPTPANIGRVLTLLPEAVLDSAVESIASRRLSAVFHKLADEIDPRAFVYLSNFKVLVGAKGPGWESAARKSIIRVDRNAFYLRVMLSILLNDYKLSVNSIVDREALKTLISVIYSKRQGRTNSPGSQLVKRVREMVGKNLAKQEQKSDEN